MTKKTVAITGISGGIGHAMAIEFQKQDYQIIGFDLDNSRFNEFRDMDCYKLDVTNQNESEELYNKVLEEYSQIDIFINNAGIAKVSAFDEIELSAHQLVMNINFTAVMNATYFWQKKMKDYGGGTIVNIASVAGHAAAPTLSSYCASKHAVVGLTKSLQQESRHNDHKVKFILVSPGFVDTGIMDVGANSLPQRLEFLINTPEDCAKKIVKGIIAGKEIIEPTFDGKAMIALNRLVPKGIELATSAVFKKIKQKK